MRRSYLLSEDHEMFDEYLAQLTLYALRVISVKFLLVISVLYKTGVVMRIKDMITQDESN